jgi:hypothetical protein
MRSLDAIKKELQERAGWSLGDENRDSKLFIKILLELVEYIDLIQSTSNHTL